MQQHTPRRDAARSPGNANQGTGGRTQRQQTMTANIVYDYTMPLPLVPALLSDAWVSEVVLSLRLHRALRRLVAALADCEVRP